MRFRHFVLLTNAIVLICLLSSCAPVDTDSTRPSPDSEGATSPHQNADPQYSPLPEGIQEIQGVVLSGGDQTPQDLQGGPRRFAFEIQLDSGEVITLTYTAYPPSPSGEAELGPQLSFHQGEIKPGDRLKAKGTYDLTTKTLTVEAEADFIITFE